MKASILLASLAALAMAGCTVVRPVAYQTVPVAVPGPTVVLNADPAAPARAGEGMSR
ncbi:MAG TPA: hypothetical protein VNS31_04305 [Ramlibacter sp.]|jgi:hypothetical protein|nr:hypothetical protein [Ramlibacter sp.]